MSLQRTHLRRRSADFGKDKRREKEELQKKKRTKGFIKKNEKKRKENRKVSLKALASSIRFSFFSFQIPSQIPLPRRVFNRADSKPRRVVYNVTETTATT